MGAYNFWNKVLVFDVKKFVFVQMYTFLRMMVLGSNYVKVLSVHF